MTAHDPALLERIAMSLHDRLYRGSWRSWPDLETEERGEYLVAARTCLDVLAAETRLCAPTDPLPRPDVVEACPNHCDHCAPDDIHPCNLPKGHAGYGVRLHSCDPIGDDTTKVLTAMEDDQWP